ncbi:hypothetical protein C8Q79DRAFT_882617, partial [Trametes meyenii]
QLSNEDKAILRAFAFHVNTNLSEDHFAQIPYAFLAEKLPSLHKIKARVTFLAGIKPQVYDCCSDSCVAYTGPFADLQECPYCKLSRYDDYGKPRRRFTYFPMEARLAALSSHRETAERMQYRGDYISDPSGTVQDVFDGDNYQALRTREVIIDGRKTGYKFFADRRDIALGLSTDGFAPWRCRKKS